MITNYLKITDPSKEADLKKLEEDFLIKIQKVKNKLEVIC